MYSRHQKNINLLCISKYFKMENEKYLKDIQDIKQMMSQSTQFISLSGLSGILAGIYALIGACIVNYLLDQNKYDVVILESVTFKGIVLTAIAVLLLSVITAFGFNSFFFAFSFAIVLKMFCRK